MLIQLSVAFAAAAFIALAVFLILTLRKGMTTLGETNKTLGEVRNAIHGLTGEATQAHSHGESGHPGCEREDQDHRSDL